MRRWQGVLRWQPQRADQQGSGPLVGAAHQRRRTSKSNISPRPPTHPPMGLLGPISQAGASGLIVAKP